MIIWNWFYSFIDILVMFDICKIYPIWLPHCIGDAWVELINSCRVIVESFNMSFAEAVKNLADAFDNLKRAGE